MPAGKGFLLLVVDISCMLFMILPIINNLFTLPLLPMSLSLLSSCNFRLIGPTQLNRLDDLGQSMRIINIKLYDNPIDALLIEFEYT